jgi:hypothetical protein
MPIVGFLVFLVLGLFQLAAIQAGLSDWRGLHWTIAVPLSVSLAYCPLVGTVLGFIGAINVWHWEWWQAALLFFGGLGLSLALGGIAAMSGTLTGRATR